MSTAPVNLVEERTANVNREAPDWLVREIRKVGGMAGDKPRFRVVWGGSRWTVGPDGRSLIRPYRVDMWHIEKLHQGEYEHCYRIGECPAVGPPHRKTKADRWCKPCFFSGGVPIEADEALALIEMAIRLIVRTEELQKTARFAAAQRDALLGREAEKEAQRDAALADAVRDAAPRTVQRSFDTPLRMTAQQAMGAHSGLRQMNAREIARGMRKKARQA